MWYENSSLWTILEPLYYASYATLVHGELGLEILSIPPVWWLNQSRTPIGDESLRHFVSVNKKDWAKLLNVAQFSYNLQRSETTNKMSLEVASKQQPLNPHT